MSRMKEKQNSKIKATIVGCGSIAHVHVPRILKNKYVELAALCDNNKIRLEDMTRCYKVPSYIDFSKMLEEVRPDVVHILTPPATHAKLAVEALKNGSHVLIEKPACLTVEELNSVYKAAESAGRMVSIDHCHLWSPLVIRARQVLESGQLGDIRHIQYTMSDDFLEVVKSGYGRWALSLTGGIMGDLISHPLYLIGSFLNGMKINSVRASGSNICNLKELFVDFTADKGGANLWMSLEQRPIEHSMRIFCTRGTVNIDLHNYSLAVVPERSLPGPLARIVNVVTESWQRGSGTVSRAFGLVMGQFDPDMGIAGSMNAFYRSILEDRESPVSRESAVSVVRLTEEVWGRLDEISEIAGAKADKIKTGISAHGKNAEVLVTGGTGFIGRHLVNRLVSEGRRVRILCRSGSPADFINNDAIELFNGDICDIDSVYKAMQGVDTVYHLAAATGGDRAVYYQSTIKGTENILKTAFKAGVKKMVYVSSLGILQSSRFPNGKAVDESFPLEGRSLQRGDYSHAKLAAEMIVKKYMNSGKLDICIIRPGLVYGTGVQELFSDAGLQISRHIVLVLGTGRRLLGLTYVENLVDALVLAEHSKGNVYHIVDSDQPSVREYLRVYSTVSGKSLIKLYVPTFVWLGGFKFLDLLLCLLRGSSSNFTYKIRSISKGPRFNISRARDVLGWNPRVQFTEGMRRAFK